jgi:hypothetical protein
LNSDDGGGDRGTPQQQSLDGEPRADAGEQAEVVALSGGGGACFDGVLAKLAEDEQHAGAGHVAVVVQRPHSSPDSSLRDRITILVNLGLFRHFETVTNIRTWIRSHRYWRML